MAPVAWASRAPLYVVDGAGGRSVGAVEVHASPEEIRAALLNFPRWPQLFGDVKSAVVKSRTAAHAVVEVSSHSAKRKHKLRVRIDDPRRTPFELLDGRGVKLWGEFSFEPARPGVTRIRGHLLAKTTGIVGLLVRERTLRGESRAKLRGYLTDLGVRFWRG